MKNAQTCSHLEKQTQKFVKNDLNAIQIIYDLMYLGPSDYFIKLYLVISEALKNSLTYQLNIIDKVLPFLGLVTVCRTQFFVFWFEKNHHK